MSSDYRDLFIPQLHGLNIPPPLTMVRSRVQAPGLSISAYLVPLQSRKIVNTP